MVLTMPYIVKINCEYCFSPPSGSATDTSTDAESLNHVLFLPALNCDCDNMKNCDGNNTLK